MQKILSFPENLIHVLAAEGLDVSAEELLDAIQELPGRSREYIVKYYQLHQTQRKIAEDFGISTGQANKQLHDAVKRLQCAIEQDDVPVARFRITFIPDCEHCIWCTRIDEDRGYCFVRSCPRFKKGRE